jgi:hypothetical protein
MARKSKKRCSKNPIYSLGKSITNVASSSIPIVEHGIENIYGNLQKGMNSGVYMINKSFQKKKYRKHKTSKRRRHHRR